MIHIDIRKHNKIKPTHLSPLSGFINFNYDAKIVDYIKSLGNRVYLPDSKEWEVPMSSIANICNYLSNYDIEITGEMVKNKPANTNLPQGFNFKTQPYSHQLDGVLYGLNNNTFLLGDDQGLGKALVYGTKVLTPKGYVNIEELNVGDYVIAVDGKPTKVTAVYDHKSKLCYDVVFTDNSRVTCCEDHLWEVYAQDVKKIWDTKTLASKPMRNKTNWNYYIPLTEPVEFEENSVDFEPYLLGLFLGDGSLTGETKFLTVGKNDIEYITNYLDSNNISYTSKMYDDSTYTIWFKGEDRKCLNSLVNEYGLNCRSEFKFIPDCYMFSSVTSRFELLRGLMDTDGYASKDNLIQFSSSSSKLAEQVKWLCESLGAICTINEYDTTHLNHFTVTIKHSNPQLFFNMPRKRDRLKPRRFKAHRNFKSITEAGYFDCRCISVEHERELYLVENFIVTHNTKQIIDIAVAKKNTEGLKHCLIVCGVNSTKYNWANEVKIHSNEDSWVLGTRYGKRPPYKAFEGSSQDKLDDLNNLPKAFFIVTNIETLRAMSKKVGKKYSFPIAEKIQQLCERGEIGMIAFDEAHKAKNPDSQQGKALLGIKPKCAIPMSGTFLVNNPLDLYLPLRWSGFIDTSFYAYKNHYCRMGGFGGQEIIGYKNLDELRSLMSEVMLRRTKGEVLDLPEKIKTVEYVEMYKEQEKIYDEAKKAIKQEIDKVKLSPNPLAQMIRLRQATGYPGILSTSVIESAKMDRMLDLVEEMTDVGEKVIVYSQWEQMTAVALRKLKKYNPAYITGDTKSEDRMSQVNKFQTDDSCKVIIGTIGAMGTGLTLTAATNVIFLDQPWNRALQDQAEDRAHRIGTKSNVRIITIVCKDTIDEKILDIVDRKGKMSDRIIDGKFEIVDTKAFIDYVLS